jgi:hypothetical protein
MEIVIQEELILHGNLGTFPPYLHAPFGSWAGTIAAVVEDATMPAIT